MLSNDEIAGFELFADFCSTAVVARFGLKAGTKKRVKGRKNEIKPVLLVKSSEDDLEDAAELSDFVQVWMVTLDSRC